ncbi:alpha/beta fold hydrolase [Streptomyces sp. NPDC001027]|uniref:alpha/beta fold hydrolase n=1 Tax=Streptomyces sp. NPDC001027 TaxID=3154771 RepID=UPI003316C026
MSGQGHTALVLVHGGWFADACWEPVLPHLSTTCLSPDLPGRAGRPADLTTLTIGDLARTVADDIDAAGLDHVVRSTSSWPAHGPAWMDLPSAQRKGCRHRSVRRSTGGRVRVGWRGCNGNPVTHGARRPAPAPLRRLTRPVLL